MQCHFYQTKPIAIRFLHWIVVILTLAALVSGYSAFNFNWTADGFFSRDLLFIIHRSAGLLIAFLFLVWLVLRLPKIWHSRRETRWQQAVAISHITIAALGFAIPFLAWIGRGVGSHSAELFSLLPRYNLVSKAEGHLPYFILELHKTLIPWFLVLVGVHIIATLVHQFYLRDNLYGSMFFNCKQKLQNTSANSELVTISTVPVK